MDPEDVSALLSHYHARVRAELERFGGTVEKFIGDAVVALFGAPVAHEDDPERAVRAALAIRDWTAGEPDLHVRLAVNTGEALVALVVGLIDGACRRSSRCHDSLYWSGFAPRARRQDGGDGLRLADWTRGNAPGLPMSQVLTDARGNDARLHAPRRLPSSRLRSQSGEAAFYDRQDWAKAERDFNRPTSSTGRTRARDRHQRRRDRGHPLRVPPADRARGRAGSFRDRAPRRDPRPRGVGSRRRSRSSRGDPRPRDPRAPSQPAPRPAAARPMPALRAQLPERRRTGAARRVRAQRADRREDAVMTRADAEYARKIRARRRGAEPPSHGLNGYTKYACRCDVCRAANTAAARLPHRQPARRRARSAYLARQRAAP